MVAIQMDLLLTIDYQNLQHHPTPKFSASRDYFSGLPIANAALILQTWCGTQRHGYSGDYMKDEFALVYWDAITTRNTYPVGTSTSGI